MKLHEFAPPGHHDAVPCPFIRAWIGRCGETDRTKCRHSRAWTWAMDGDVQGPYGKQRDDRCLCGKPALSECESAGSFVCGAPICHVGFCAGHGGRCV